MGARRDDALPFFSGAWGRGGIALIALLAGASAQAGEQACEFRRNGAPTELFVCAASGAWTVHCPAPPSGGRVRATMSMPDRNLKGEARVSLGASGPMALGISGPGGKPSPFLVDRKVAGLLPGQAIGPQQLCPVVQPGVPAGSPPRELPIEVVISIHEILGYDEIPLDGGVLGSVPRYDAGTVWARGRATVVQHEIPLIPILAGADAIPMDDEFRGTVSVRKGEAWASVGYTAFVRPVALAHAHVDVLVVDFVAPEVEAALAQDPAAAIRDDLARWLAGESTPFTPTVWARSEVAVPLWIPRWSEPGGSMAWRDAETERVQVRVGRSGMRLRAVIARSSAPLDPAIRRAIGTAASPP